MQVELSANAEATLKLLVTADSSAEQIVELAISELAEQRDNPELPQCYIDPQTRRVFTSGELKDQIQKGLDDIAAGRVTELETDDDLRNYMQDVKKRGRDRFASSDS